MNATQSLRASTIAVLLAIAPAGAFAADLPVRTAPPGGGPLGGPPPIPYYNWSGFYIGGNLGGAFESGTVTNSIPFFGQIDSLSRNGSGFIGGAQVGYNWQFAPTWVVGVEWTFDGADLRSTDVDTFNLISTTSKVDWITTVAGRLGYAANNWLFYAKGGGGWVHETTTVTDLFPAAFGFPVSVADLSDTKGGWLVGAGVEYGISPNWTIRVDYTHICLSDTTGPGPVTIPFDTVNISHRFDLVTAGVNYRF